MAALHTATFSPAAFAAGTRALIGPRGKRLRSPLIKPGPARKLAREINRDADVLLGAAIIEQFRFFRALAPRLLESARTAFERGSEFLAPSFDFRFTSFALARLARLFAASRTLGFLRVQEELGVVRFSSFEFRETLSGVPPKDAIRYLESLPIVDRARWEEFIRRSQNQAAFTVSGLDRAATESMRDLIVQSLRSGLSPEQFNRAATDLLRNFEISPSRLRTIWNTNVSSAIQRGRDAAFEDPDVARTLTWGIFDAIDDNVVRSNHLALDNSAAPRDWWLSHPELMPLLGFNCRCQLFYTTSTNARRQIAAGQLRDLSVEGVPLGAGRDLGFGGL